jgi:hypothetical protein
LAESTICINAFAIKKLKNNESEITFQPHDRLQKTSAFFNAELLIATQMGGLRATVTTRSPMEFVGGGF